MMNKINWIDFRTLVRQTKIDDDKDDFGLFSFIFDGARGAGISNVSWWWILIPGLNVIPALYIAFMIVTSPIRLLIIAFQKSKLRKNAYDIEDTTTSLARLIRNKKGDIGLCVWGDSYEYSRKVILKPKYCKIDRRVFKGNNLGFIVTDKMGKMGLYIEPGKWLFTCVCDNIKVVSDDLIIITINNNSQHYNSKGERVIV